LAQFAVLITHREVLGTEPTLKGLQSLLKKYQRREAILILSKLNILLGTWQNTPNFDVDVRLSKILLNKHSAHLAELRSSNTKRVVFSRLTLLFLVKQACLVCEDKGSLVNTADARDEIGLACLMANDLILPSLPLENAGILSRLALLIPFSDYISSDHYAMEIARSQQLFGRIPDTSSMRARRDFIDIASLFEHTVGLSYETFTMLIFGCMAKFLSVTPEQLESPDALILRSTYFQKSAIDQEAVTEFIRKITIPESKLADKVRESVNRPGDDLTVFQAFPLIEIADGLYTCLDPGFLIDKAGRGLYWTLFSELSNDQRGQLASFWGAVFENYVNLILNESYKAKGTFVPEPKFPNGEQAFDACLVEGGSLVVFEHKSSTMRADAKYGGDVEKLKEQLHLKFVEGDEDGAKGVAQLNRSVQRFLQGEAIENISSNDIHTVYPVLVCLDNTVSVPYMGLYFREQFRSMFPRKKCRKTVTPVFTLNISDVENLLGYLAKFTMSDILENFYRENRTMVTSISSSNVPLLKDAKEDRNCVREWFSEFAKHMEKTLFPKEGSSSN
jgi:hypothetical protein